MKKKYFIFGGLVAVLVVMIMLGVIFIDNMKKEKEIDYSTINVEKLVDKVKNSDKNSFELLDCKIRNGYFEGIFYNNSDVSYDYLEIKVNFYDKDGKKIDDISFIFNNINSYEERDLYYPIQSDLSDAYYIDIVKDL